MTTPTRIVSRDSFKKVLQEAVEHTRRLAGIWAPQADVQAQLEFMARTTANRRVPGAHERTRTSIGPLAVRNLEESDPSYADQLKQLDYTFRRYHLLPSGPAVRRRGVLQVWSGPEAFRKLVLAPGDDRTVGSADAQLLVRGESPLGAPHFQILWDGVSAFIRALGPPHPITIDGLPAYLGELAHRGWMTAAHTTFRFLVEDRTPPPTPRPPTPTSTAALTTLAPLHAAGTLYAVIDAARSERALQLVEESIDPYASLYDGERGRAFDAVAPYLVHLATDSQLLERLVHEGWGESWGIYLESRAGFDAVRRHLRQFLKVAVEGEPEPLFFRFYDPRVLQTFAEVITPEQRRDLLAQLDALLYERQDGSVATMRHG